MSRRPSARGFLVPVIAYVVASAFGLPNIMEPRSQSRRHEAERIMARGIAVALVAEYTDLSYPQIAKAFGFSDHTTIFYHSKRQATMECESPEYKRVMDYLRDQIDSESKAVAA